MLHLEAAFVFLIRNFLPNDTVEPILAASKLVFFYGLKTPGVRNIKLKMTQERERKREGERMEGVKSSKMNLLAENGMIVCL